MKPAAVSITRRQLLAAAPALAGAALPDAGLAQATNSTTSTTATSTATAPVQLRFGWWGGGERHKRTLEAIALFESRHPGVSIKAEYMGFNGYLEKLTMQMVGGTEPDIMQINWAWLSMFSKDGQGFLDLYRHRDRLSLAQFSDEDRRLCEVRGRLNGLPPSYSARIFLWNAAAFERAGVPLPSHWDALFSSGQAFRQRLGERFYPLDGEIYDMLLLAQSWVTQRHGMAYLHPSEPRVAMSREALQDWVAAFRRLGQQHVATPLRYRASLGGADKPTEQQPDWVNGRWAGNYTWDSTIRLRQSTLDKQQRLALGEPLMLPGASSSGVFGRPAMLFSASRNTRHPEWAARFIDFLLTDADASRVLGLVRGLPSARSALEVALADRKLTPLEKQAWQQIQSQRAAGRIPLPSPVFEDARMRKFLRDTFERVSYDRLGVVDAAERLLVHGNALLRRIH
ncbi:ABC transporter substrate-binding protein [Aquabacterium sp. OR-4]|uniref:ABC transporter substrate-binding protein n=1 Tax=Aquabacterium sp. OR-4 TaxID=2978127 RepID=UPI0021B43BF1|nr:ABC transporter substrate-binding protein [Aquabacterium sp. OR-4]MDT7837094.1 ABC transporter substrate-binding protein [Aquabacterium sp. OR-4]